MHGEAKQQSDMLPRVPRSQLNFLELLGEGMFGEVGVVCCTHRPDKNQI